MGSLVYATGRPEPIELDDRTLAHLQIVIASKLRMRQSFFFSWVNSADAGGGRNSIWLDTAIPVTFSYAKPERQKINREWVELLMASAHSNTGLRLMREPATEPGTAQKIELVARAWSSAHNLVRS
jgi:hypothetical protein